jgi:hypothetical protein
MQMHAQCSVAEAQPPARLERRTVRGIFRAQLSLGIARSSIFVVACRRRAAQLDVEDEDDDVLTLYLVAEPVLWHGHGRALKARSARRPVRNAA